MTVAYPHYIISSEEAACEGYRGVFVTPEDPSAPGLPGAGGVRWGLAFKPHPLGGCYPHSLGYFIARLSDGRYFARY